MSDYYIPTELLDEVLVRVPVESLIRFKSVCKTWYSLITSPSFITKHNKTNNENLLLIAWTLIELECPFSSPAMFKRIAGSCRGLLCMFDDNLSICLWNPSIRKSVTLPMPALQEIPPLFFLGFGAHPTTDEYMLVFIAYGKADVAQGKFPSKVELYTQGAGSWRSVTSVGHPGYIKDCDNRPVFVNGAIHWIAYDSRVVNGFRCLVMLFNMGSQAFSEMMIPAALVNQKPSRMSVVSYGESLAVLRYGALAEGSCCLWVMKEYGVAESWAKLYNISIPGEVLRIVGFRKNGEVLVFTSNQLLRYNCETKTWTNARYTGSSYLVSAGNFMESLVLLEQGNDVF